MKRRSLISVLLVRIGVPLVTLLVLGFAADQATARGRRDVQARPTSAAKKKKAHRAVVEVVQSRDGRQTHALSATVQVLSESRPSRVELTRDRARCRIALSVEREGVDALVRLDLRWSERSKKVKGKVKGKVRGQTAVVSMSSRVAVGKRVLLGRFSQASGAEFLVYLTLS